MKTLGYFGLLAVLVSAPVAADCPLGISTKTGLPAVTSDPVLVATDGSALVFRSGLERDDDGAPNAYHVGTADGGPDPGLDHICNGLDVLEMIDGRLVNKYAEGGSIGGVGGVDPATGIKRAALCKADYIAIRDAGFPRCGAGELCARIYGFLVKERSCGFNKINSLGCGVPVRQLDADGNETDFYVSQNTLRRPGSAADSRLPSDYANPLEIPFIVMPPQARVPGGPDIEPGDLAIVLKGKTLGYAVVGDSGPKDKLGEASRALLKGLGGGTVEVESPVTTILFPGTAHLVRTGWPLDPATFESEALGLLGQLGSTEDLRDCPGLERLP